MFKVDQKKNLENKIEITSKGKICLVYRIANPIKIVIRQINTKSSIKIALFDIIRKRCIPGSSITEIDR